MGALAGKVVVVTGAARGQGAAEARLLASQGARVGILDADIYGPSQPLMLGLEGQRPASTDGSSRTSPRNARTFSASGENTIACNPLITARFYRRRPLVKG